MYRLLHAVPVPTCLLCNRSHPCSERGPRYGRSCRPCSARSATDECALFTCRLMSWLKLDSTSWTSSASSFCAPWRGKRHVEFVVLARSVRFAPSRLASKQQANVPGQAPSPVSLLHGGRQLQQPPRVLVCDGLQSVTCCKQTGNRSPAGGALGAYKHPEPHSAVTACALPGCMACTVDVAYTYLHSLARSLTACTALLPAILQLQGGRGRVLC
jgi:hypothetical protein